MEREIMVNETKQYIVVKLGGEQYGIDISYVDNIVRMQKITRVPNVQPYFKGIINLRGQIIPIVDIRLRLGKPSIDMEMENSDTCCIIVLDIDSISVGIIVDSVSQVVDSELSKISPVPVNNQQELVNGMISLDVNNVVLLLDCQQLVDTQMMN